MNDPVRHGDAPLTQIQPNARFDVAGLAAFLRREVAPFDGALEVQQFLGGQSNPTYRVRAGEQVYVMRKKPGGILLPSAHAIDREYRAMQAMAQAGLPVPRMRAFCDDAQVIGQAFYVMDYVEGRVFHDRALPGCSPAERSALYGSMVENLAKLSQVDPVAVGLDGFGRPGGYIARQVARWSTQYLASGLEPCAAMDRLIAWLPAHAPAEGAPGVVHGDYRLGNLLFHPTRPEVVAILDWELSTIGDPLADLAYTLMPYKLPDKVPGGLGGLDLRALGIPPYEACVARYCALTGREGLPDFDYYLVFSMFRSAAIAAGVYRRALDGNGADPSGLQLGASYRVIAEAACEVASNGR